MAIFHLMRLERSVRIGGLPIRLGLLRGTIGGRDYTVGPISVFRWIRLLAAVSPFLEGKPLSRDFGEVIKKLGIIGGRIFLPLFLDDKIREKDLSRARMSEILSAFYAFCEVNDLEYIQAEDPDKKKKAEDASLTYDDWALILTERTSGARLPDEFLRLPIQYFLSMIDSFERINNVREERPADSRAPTEEEKALLKAHFKAQGIGVI